MSTRNNTPTALASITFPYSLPPLSQPPHLQHSTIRAFKLLDISLFWGFYPLQSKVFLEPFSPDPFAAESCN